MVKEKILLKNISVRFGYEHMNEVMKISKAEKLLGWKPKVDIEEGLKKTVEYFRSQI